MQYQHPASAIIMDLTRRFAKLAKEPRDDAKMQEIDTVIRFLEVCYPEARAELDALYPT